MQFVLVHGAWHGAWCWYRVVHRLEAAGHGAVAFDLPAHGTDTAPVAEVTLDDHADRTVAALDRAEEPVVLVGHSMGGAVVSQAAERRPEAVDALVYLAAHLLPDGTSLMDVVDTDLDLMTVDDEAGRITVEADLAAPAFYSDCDPEDRVLARTLLRPEPLGSFTVPLDLTEEGFGSLRRVYLRTTADEALPPAKQERMYTEMPCSAVRSLATGHSPFLSAPDELVEHLLAV